MQKYEVVVVFPLLRQRKGDANRNTLKMSKRILSWIFIEIIYESFDLRL